MNEQHLTALRAQISRLESHCDRLYGQIEDFEAENDRLRDERDRYYEAICDTLQHPGDGRAVFRRLRAALDAEDGDE